MISSHDKYKKASPKKLRHRENITSENCPMSAVYDTKQSSPHPKKFRQRRKINYIDSENSEMSDNDKLQFSGNTRWYKFDPIVIDEIETLQQKVNKIYKVLETVPKMVMMLVIFYNTEEHIVAQNRCLFQL